MEGLRFYLVLRCKSGHISYLDILYFHVDITFRSGSNFVLNDHNTFTFPRYIGFAHVYLAACLDLPDVFDFHFLPQDIPGR